MHLKVDELIDLAEGARAESSSPHLAGCARCRAALVDLRATMSAAAGADVPEPSPLFWDHLSNRVHDAVAVAAADARANRRSFLGRVAVARMWQVWVAAAAALVLVVAAGLRTGSPVSSDLTTTPPAVEATEWPASRPDLFADSPVDNDPSLSLVASLASDVDAADDGLANVGSADHAVMHMNDAELHELQRLLQDALAP